MQVGLPTGFGVAAGFLSPPRALRYASAFAACVAREAAAVVQSIGAGNLLFQIEAPAEAVAAHRLRPRPPHPRGRRRTHPPMWPPGCCRAALPDLTSGEPVSSSRKAGIDAVNEAYDRHPLGEPDEWSDVAAFLDADLLHKRTIPRDGVFREA